MALFVIVADGMDVGVIPDTALLRGSSDLNDILNSWVTFTKNSLNSGSGTVHPLAAFAKGNDVVMQRVLELADSFRFEEPAHPVETKGRINYNGESYYVIKQERNVNGSLTLNIQSTQIVDAQNQSARDSDTIKKNLDLVHAFVTKIMLDSLSSKAFHKAITQKPVAVAGPARHPLDGVMPVTPTPYSVVKILEDQAKGMPLAMLNGDDATQAQGKLAAFLNK